MQNAGQKQAQAVNVYKFCNFLLLLPPSRIIITPLPSKGWFFMPIKIKLVVKIIKVQKMMKLQILLIYELSFII